MGPWIRIGNGSSGASGPAISGRPMLAVVSIMILACRARRNNVVAESVVNAPIVADNDKVLTRNRFSFAGGVSRPAAAHDVWQIIRANNAEKEMLHPPMRRSR